MSPWLLEQPVHAYVVVAVVAVEQRQCVAPAEAANLPFEGFASSFEGYSFEMFVPCGPPLDSSGSCEESD